MVTDIRLSKLAQSFGKDEARLVWLVGCGGEHDRADFTTHRERLPLQTHSRLLHASLEGDQDESAELEKEAALARELGFDAAFLKSVPFVKKPGLRFRQPSQVPSAACICRDWLGRSMATARRSSRMRSLKIEDEPWPRWSTARRSVRLRRDRHPCAADGQDRL